MERYCGNPEITKRLLGLYEGDLKSKVSAVLYYLAHPFRLINDLCGRKFCIIDEETNIEDNGNGTVSVSMRSRIPGGESKLVKATNIPLIITKG